MKENENYDRMQKNLIIYSKLNKFKMPLNVKAIKNKIRSQKSLNHKNGHFVNRKKEAKRIDMENKKMHSRMKTIKEK